MRLLEKSKTWMTSSAKRDTASNNRVAEVRTNLKKLETAWLAHCEVLEHSMCTKKIVDFEHGRKKSKRVMVTETKTAIGQSTSYPQEDDKLSN